jgi:hypothetical protein
VQGAILAPDVYSPFLFCRKDDRSILLSVAAQSEVKVRRIRILLQEDIESADLNGIVHAVVSEPEPSLTGRLLHDPDPAHLLVGEAARATM